MSPLKSLQQRLDRFHWPQLGSRVAVPLLGVVIVGAPLALGGAPPATVPVFALLAALALFVTGWTRETVRRDAALPILAVLVGVSALQLVPLPPWLLGRLDAVSAEASRYVWSAYGEDRGARWRPLHYDPGTGLSDLVYLLGLGALYLAAKRAAMRDRAQAVYNLASWAALAVALVALAHLVTGQDKLYAVYAPRHAAPPILAPLLNANHLAALAGVGAVLWLGRALDAPRDASRILPAAAALACAVVGALTRSRGGVAAMVGGVALLVALNARRVEPDATSHRRRPSAGPLLGMLVAMAVLAGGLYVAAASLAAEYQSGDVSKLQNFRQALGLLRGRELLGVGSGGLTAAVGATGRLDPNFTFLRIESLPLDLALSFGLLAGAAALVLGGRALYKWFPPSSAPATVMALWAALVSLVAHDLVDFALFLGGVGYVAAAVAGTLAAHRALGWRKKPAEHGTVVRLPVLALVALVAALAPVAARSPLEAERDHLEATLRASPRAYRSEETRAALRRHPFDAYMQLLAGTYAVTQRDPDALRFVTRALALAPDWAQPHVLLARVFQAQGLRSQSLVEAREALTRSRTAVESVGTVLLRLAPPPTREELERVAPPGPTGLALLAALASPTARARAPALATLADTVHLARAPDAPGPLARLGAAALEGGDAAEARRFCDRLVRAEPALPDGYLCRAEALVRAHDAAGAARVLQGALARVADRYPIHGALAKLYAQQGNAAEMRRAIEAMQEAAGSDVVRLSRAHAALGGHEEALGHDRAAYLAYEQADRLAVPEHPHLISMARVASRLNDREALEGACVLLMEREPPEPAAETYCVRARSDGGAMR